MVHKRGSGMHKKGAGMHKRKRRKASGLYLRGSGHKGAGVMMTGSGVAQKKCPKQVVSGRVSI